MTQRMPPLFAEEFAAWLRALAPSTVLGPTHSLFLEPLTRFLREQTGESYVALPDAVALWDGYGFSPVEVTPVWARALLWALDDWGGEYTAADVLTLLEWLQPQTKRETR